MAITYGDRKRKVVGPPGVMGRRPVEEAHPNRVTNLRGSQPLYSIRGGSNWDADTGSGPTVTRKAPAIVR
ncbi:hypothetical protein SADUNF_Sadunf01G0107400 [Salix dunnii]|uniref:Uncharacterized protein n=1 Tax=Salix dunnii TaxID=1413687 RepID=A0A835NB79_9ROSI|nr:hypothetical protein SADUNF_Sadunf01G0107400 [Salix dunnii]